MNLNSVLFWTCLFLPCLAFRRTSPDISPFNISYANEAGVPDTLQLIKYNSTGDGAGVKSYWFVAFLTLENGHDYFLLHGTTNAGPQQLQVSISLMDITAKQYSGGYWFADRQVSSSTIDNLSPDLLHIYTTTPDHFSEVKAISVIPEYTFNLTHTPKGPNSYQVGAGTYIWGDGRCFAWDNPQAWTEGTLRIDGTDVAVVPEKSFTWMDYQYGPGFASEGWYSFILVLDNGICITTMTLLPTPKYVTGSIATIVYPNGHHEVYTVDENFHPKDPWVSPDTNITYYKSYQVNIPGKGISLNVRLAMEGGELFYRPDLHKALKIADTFAYFWGTFDGQPVTGVGNAERFAGLNS